jgi:NADH dehydrogenase FAD-containing subunit
MAKSNVVIVGGGGYGIKMASSLSTKLDPSKHTLTLISSREFFLHLPAMLRLMVTGDEQIRTTAMMPYDRLFKRVGTYLRGTVIEIKKNAGGKSGTVILDSGKELPWDILLLAPGNKWEGGLRIPETHEEVKIFIEEWRQRFEKANKITLVGGGPVGIELSGELREYYPVSGTGPKYQAELIFFTYSE